MVESRPSRSVEELLAALDELPTTGEIDRTATALGWMSSDRLLERLGSRRRTLRARFSGALPSKHELGVRASTTVLGEFQEALSEIGAVTTGHVPARGPLPTDILAATELRFAPAVSPGSVIFTLHPATDDGELWQTEDGTVLDDSMTALFSLFQSVERPTSQGVTADSDVSDELRTFGPRTARHLVRFAQVLAAEGLTIDFGWSDRGGEAMSTRLTSAGAAYLSDLAAKATTRVRELTLRGRVHRLGDDNKHRFIDDERGEISITSTDALTDQLTESFRRAPVIVAAEETESVNVATGKSTHRFVALDVKVLRGEEV